MIFNTINALELKYIAVITVIEIRPLPLAYTSLANPSIMS